jgi:predicted GIY-YIG superfamily endonuclease
MNHYVYIIKGTKLDNPNKTKYYIGYTVDPKRRIMQHNRLKSNGAKSTAGYNWNYQGLISNINDNIEGLQIEWHLKHSTKKTNIISRINAFLEYLEKHNKPSQNAGILDHKILFSLHDDLYNKIEKKEGWTNVIIINVSDNDLQGNPGCSF